jgi:hypothetical protein
MVMQTFVFSFDNVKLTSNLDLQLELRVTIAGYYCSDYWGRCMFWAVRQDSGTEDCSTCGWEGKHVNILFLCENNNLKFSTFNVHCENTM